MKLSEEIAALMCERYCGISVMALPEYLPADVEIADELVNKVCEYYGYKDSDITMLGSAHEADIRADERNKVLDSVYFYIEAINKLRQEK